ncbi:hypothetical protein ACFT8P_35210 [Streptomyces sp. NPDC057101]|uniref:hypothetical protein n=1 Tax=Streptomyces sp. NPDC057101 TaxID=3346020 RepID=UPI00363DA0BA
MSDVRRVYGTDPGEDDQPQPGRTYAELTGGPLDGQLLDLTGWGEDSDGAALLTATGHYGPGGRSLYSPDPDSPGRWVWEGDTPA